MASVNKSTIIGNLGRDPEVRATDSGAKVARFSVATTETWKNKDGEKQSATEWHNVVLWRGLAEVAEKFLKKGSQVYIEGKLKTTSYDKDGVVTYSTFIEGKELVMLGRKEDNNSGQNTPPPAQSITEPPVMNGEDDLPF